MVQTQVDSLVCVALDIQLWTGRRKLTPKDLDRVASSDLPPADLASLGSKKICDPELVNEFTRLKRAAERAILQAGYRIWGIYALPEDRLSEVLEKLAAIKDEFQAYKDRFIRNYEVEVAKWVAAHKEWASIIQKSVTPVEDVKNRLYFGFRVFRVKPAPTEEGDDGVMSMMEDSYHAILKEVAQLAGETWDKSFKGRSVVTQRATRPIRTMREKLNGLSFIDPRIFPVVEQIDAILTSCPKTGKIEGGALQGLNGLMLLLSDTERMTAHGEAAIGIANGAIEPEQEEETPATAEITESVADEVAEVETPAREEAPDEVVTPVRKAPAVSESGLFF